MSQQLWPYCIITQSYFLSSQQHTRCSRDVNKIPQVYWAKQGDNEGLWSLNKHFHFIVSWGSRRLCLSLKASYSKENGIQTKTASVCNAHTLFMQYHIASTSIIIKAALLYLTVCWSQGRQGVSREAGRRYKEPEELQTHFFSPDRHSSHNSRHAVFACGWPNGHSHNAAARAFQVELI